MPTQISYSKATLSYPVYSATFAHNNPGCLVVGGGGGPGRSGVGNKITVFDVSNPTADLQPTAELELSRDEDSVTSLANLATKDGLILYAGINSSEEECLKDRNQHFRSFEVVYPRRKKHPEKDLGETAKPWIRPLGKTQLFNPFTTAKAKEQGYQGLVRLSPSRRGASGTKRIGAIASRFGYGENQIVVFNATVAEPQSQKDVIQRITPPKGEEAHDVDIIEPEEGQFKLAYCTDYDVFISDFGYDFGKKLLRGDDTTAHKKYEVPPADKARQKIRFVRWLSPSHLLILANLPNKSGVELSVVRFYGDTMGSVALRKRLARHVKAAVDMDVSLLDADEKGEYQIVVAVAGNDISTTIFTMDYHGTDANTVSRLHPYTTFRDVHPQGITKLVFSPFQSPWSGQQAEKLVNPGPQYLRLASTSYGNTVVVDTFTLKSTSSRPRSRYILSSAKSRVLTQSVNWLIVGITLLVMLLLAQSLFDPEGRWTGNYLPARRTGPAIHNRPGPTADGAQHGKAGVTAGPQSPVAQVPQRLRDMLHLYRHEGGDSKPKAVVIQQDPDTGSLNTAVHSGDEDAVKEQTDAKKWEDLSHAEQNEWKEKLVRAGAWAVDEGETVLKGIFFGQAAGLVGAVAQGVLNG